VLGPSLVCFEVGVHRFESGFEAAVVELPSIGNVSQPADVSVVLVRHALCISDVVIKSLDLPSFSKIPALDNAEVGPQLIEFISPGRQVSVGLSNSCQDFFLFILPTTIIKFYFNDLLLIVQFLQVVKLLYHRVNDCQVLGDSAVALSLDQFLK
jgi:hypothetical protein